MAERIIDVDGHFNPAESIRKGDIILQIRIPHVKPNQVVFFDKQARRKTAELAVANIAISAEVTAAGKLTSVRVALGGVEAAVKDCTDKAVPNAIHIANLLAEQGLASSKQQIQEAVRQDLNSASKDQYRVGVFTSFVLKFLSQLAPTNEKPNGKAKEETVLKAHQLFQKVPVTQPDIDPVTRPLAHVSAAQQCTGEAVYVDDLPVTSQVELK
jgi:xanthine dehydrogenase iron-sulfur cluster and FAD-binding subunit A